MTSNRLLRTALVTCIAALLLSSGATAGPYISAASTSHARAGDIVRVSAGAGLRLYELLPLYLVAAAQAPVAYRCSRRGHAGTCRPTASHAPRGGIYHLIGTLNVRKRTQRTIAFRVPSLPPGRYTYVLYCGWCARGPAGSLIAWAPRPTLTILR
jgi:hypothetical protein